MALTLNDKIKRTYTRFAHGVPKGGQKEKKLSGFGAYIFGIDIPRGFRL